MLKEDNVIESSADWGNVFLAALGLLLLAAAYSSFNDSFNAPYVQLYPFMGGLLLSFIALLFFWLGYQAKKVSAFNDRLELRRLSGGSVQVVYYDTIRFWTEKREVSKGNTYYTLGLYTDTGKYKLSSRSFNNYKQLKEIITKGKDENKTEEAILKIKEQRLTGIIFIGFSLFFLSAFFLSVTRRSSDIRPGELSPVMGVLSNSLQVSSTGGKHPSHYMILMLKEYPDFRFRIASGPAFKAVNPHDMIMNISAGDSITLDILTETAQKKISHEVPLGFFDKSVRYGYIDIYGLRHHGLSYMTVEGYNQNRAQSSADVGNLFLGLIFLFLFSAGMWGVWKSNSALRTAH